MRTRDIPTKVFVLLVVLLALVLALMLPRAVAAMTWDEFCAIYGELPPPPPDSTNTDVWVDPGFPEPLGDYSGGGESIADMNASAFLAAIDWTGQDGWRFS